MSFNSSLLVFPTFTIFVCGVIILSFYIKDFRISITVSFLKASLFFIYFNVFFNGVFTFLDDWSYLAQAQNYIDKGYNFFSLLQNPFQFPSIFGKKHFLYQLYNVLALHLFGSYYFAPVALNIIVTFYTSFLFYKLLLLLNVKEKFSVIFSLFYILHWETISWSNLLNFKDILIQFFEIGFIYNILKLEYRKDIYYSIIAIITLTTIFFTIRFYIPFLIFFSYIIYKIICIMHKSLLQRRLIIVAFISMIITTLFVIFLEKHFLYNINELFEHFINPVYGIFRFLLTPIPFHIEKAYSFLFFNSILNWLFLPFLFYGIYKFYKLFDKKAVYFILSYLFIIFLFYGSYKVLQGPRHRIQIAPFLIFFQLIGFLSVFYGHKIKTIMRY